MSELIIAETSKGVCWEDHLRPMKKKEIKDFPYGKRKSIRPIICKAFPDREYRTKGKIKEGVKVLEVIRIN